MPASNVIGVDFGTTTSLIGIGRGSRRASIVPIGRTTDWLPSLAAFDGGRLLIGEDAEAVHVNRILRSVKRTITENRDVVTIGQGPDSVEILADEVIASILEELVGRARQNDLDLREPDAVRLGCPAQWSGKQRQRLVDAAAYAGIDVGLNTLIDEPIAAGVAWAVEETKRKGHTVNGRLLVVDAGGGTLDIAVLEVRGDPGEDPEISVRSSVGLAMAGDVLDDAITQDLEADLRELGIDIARLDRRDEVRNLLSRGAREAKESLSSGHDFQVVIPLSDTVIPPLPYSRERLEETFRPQLERTTSLIWAALREARTSNELGNRPSEVKSVPESELVGDISYVLLVGGMSRMPIVAREMMQMFPEADLFWSHESAQELVARGLSETLPYERLNLLRPGFDFVLQWQTRDGQPNERQLYEAYSQFYDPLLAYGRDNVSYTTRISPFDKTLPRSGVGVLLARSTNKKLIGFKVRGAASHSGVQSPGFEVAFGSKEFTFRISSNGHILVNDGAGNRRELRVEKWPVLRGRDHAFLWAKDVKNMMAAGRVPELPWHLKD